MSHSPLLLQLVVILGTARVLALLLRFVGQPPVIGEMAAGLVLGPIVFGAIAPDAFHLVMASPLLSLFTQKSAAAADLRHAAR